MDILNLTQVNKLILKKQHLTEDSKIDDLIQTTDDICGLHSTGLTTSYLSLFARTNNFKKSDLERELYINRTLGRIRGMRRTLFIQTRNMIPIVYAATFKLIEKTFQKYMEFHGISLKEYQQVSKSILDMLKRKELGATEIRKRLNAKSDIPAIISLMCSNGLLIRSRPIKDWKDRRIKYALFSDYFPNIDLKELNEKEAIGQLVQKYVKSYGPVTENDIAWWTGLIKTEIRNALKSIEKRIEKVKISDLDSTFLILNSDLDLLDKITTSEAETLNLLPELDPYLMGYKERERYIDGKHYIIVFDRSGNITSTIILEGRVIGVWDTEEKPEPIVKFHLFKSIREDLYNELYSRAERIGQFFFDTTVQIKECDSMIPITERAAGGFMSPLKNC